MSKKNTNTICSFGAEFMLDQIRNLEKQIEGVQKGGDIEYVHQMRVASRRLRNGLDLFKECLPDKKFKTWLDDIRNITHALGNARDTDIQIAVLNRLYTDDLDARFKPGYTRLLLRLKQNRTKAQKKINKTIFTLQKDDTLASLASQFSGLLEDSREPLASSFPLFQKACDSIQAELGEFLSYQVFLRDQDNMDKLHAMRIAGKHLRYTMEMFAPVYNGALEPFINLMKKVQDILGEIHDNDVWVTWLPKFIEKEQERVEDYFGNTGPLIRLLPGLNHLIEDRERTRDQACQTFLLTWDSIAAENAWEFLKTTIETPLQRKNLYTPDLTSDHTGSEIEQQEEASKDMGLEITSATDIPSTN